MLCRILALAALLPAVLGIKFHGIHLGQSELEARAQIDPQTCVQFAKDIGVYHGIYSAPCTRLVGDCLTQAKPTQDPWAQASCVSAATCQGTTAVTSLLQCQDPSFDPTQAPSLEKTLFANLAQCDSCDLSFQNYVDFVYGELSAIGSQDWPSSVDSVRNDWWSYVVAWTNNTSAISYADLDDWLKHSDS